MNGVLHEREQRPVGRVSPAAGENVAWRRWRGLAVFAGGLGLWIAAAITTEVTQNLNLAATVVLLGSFLVPVTAVVWSFGHEADSALSAQRVLYAFVAGGVLGVLGASVLEAWLVQDGVLTYIGVGLVEEFVKLAALVVMGWGLTRYMTRDGIVLGSAVGFGFAALETSGYALAALRPCAPPSAPSPRTRRSGVPRR